MRVTYGSYNFSNYISIELLPTITLEKNEVTKFAITFSFLSWWLEIAIK